MDFRVDLDIFRGPLDLLLYLVRKHELEASQIPIASITEQYLEHLEVLKELDVDAVGDFLEMASTLVEIKSRMVLPSTDETSEEIEDPRDELVQRLLEYKKFKDAASLLDEQSRQWQQRYGRQADDQPPRQIDMGAQPIQEVELWDLVSAFGRVLRERQVASSASIVYDDTPIHVYMERIHRRLRKESQIRLSEMFSEGMHKSAMIGVFLAILELVRHHQVLAVQPQAHGEIMVRPARPLAEDVEFSGADDYGGPPAPPAAD